MGSSNCIDCHCHHCLVSSCNSLPVFCSILLITNKCGSTNGVYAIYNRTYLLGLLCFILMTVMGVFGCLTYRNICQTRVLAEQQADRQLTRMTLFEVILVFTCLIPYSINSVYNLITENIIKDANQLLKEKFQDENIKKQKK